MVKHIRHLHGHVYVKGMEKNLLQTASKLQELKQRTAQKAMPSGDEEMAEALAAEDKARVSRAGARAVDLSSEVAAGIIWSLSHQLFRLGKPLLKHKGKQQKVEMLAPFCRVGDGKALNPAKLQTLYRGDARLLKYADSFFFERHRPSSRPGESTGMFYPVPAMMSEVKEVEQFFQMRRESIEEGHLYGHSMGTMPLISCTLCSETLLGYRREYSAEERGPIQEEIPSNTTKPLLVKMLAAARKHLLAAHIDLSDAFRKCAPAGTSDPPPAVDISNWPTLSDRGDGNEGSPVDHTLISFSSLDLPETCLVSNRTPLERPVEVVVADGGADEQKMDGGGSPATSDSDGDEEESRDMAN